MRLAELRRCRRLRAVRAAVFVLHRDPDTPYAEFAAAVRGVRAAVPCIVNLAEETNALWADHVGAPTRPSRVAGTVVQDADARVLDPAIAALVAGADGYLVEGVVQWERVEGSPATTGLGVKQVALVGRLEGLDRAEFRRRYAEGHGPLARIQHPGVWRYTQRFVVDDLTPDAPPIDAFAELHFRTVDDFQQRFYLNDEAPNVVADDTAEFLDRSRTFTIMATEVVSTKSPHSR
jgi:uncharacterized protein (TIGR02118 family)